MSIHLELSPEAQEKLRRQKASASVVSILVSLLVIALLCVVLGLMTILIPTKEVETMISYQAPAVEQEVSNEPKVRVQNNRVVTPPSAASAVVNVITTTSQTSISIPDTNVMTNTESPDFGSMDDFGMGFGVEEAMSSSTSFFGSEVSGTRIAYVIDYSLSMQSRGRDSLMRAELTDSISNLEGGAEYSLIFWAGPVWQAGDKLNEIRQPTMVKGEDGEGYEWEYIEGKSDTFAPKGKKQKMQWTKPTRENIRRSLRHIKDTPLIWGTEWKYPLEYALDMKPAPEIIIFMTDGTSGSKGLQHAQELGKRASKEGIVINSVALMEPKAEEGMKLLAQLSGGSATMVISENEVKDMFTGEVTKR